MPIKMDRLSQPAERAELKASTRRALELASQAKFVLVTRVDEGALSKYKGAAYPDAFMPIDVVLDLERDLGAPLITEALAALQGYRLVPIDADAAQPVGLGDLAEVSKEGGDVVQKLAAAMADGALDSHERREISAEIAENIAVLRRLDRKVSGGRS